MSTRRWSLAKRTNVAVVVTTVALVLVISGSSSWFLSQSIGREIDALAKEELDEMKAGLPAAGGGVDAFRSLAARFADEHPHARMGWTLWSSKSGEVLGEFGPEDLRSLVEPGARTGGEIVSPSLGLRAGSEQLDSDLAVSLVLDGSAQLTLLYRYQLLMAGMAAVAALLAILGGTLFSRHVSGLLHQVADQVRSVHAPHGPELRVENPPEEIREVVDAFATMQANTSKHSDRVRLMTAGLAHELRSPIQNLMSETEVALLREREAGDYRAVLESHIEELRDLGRVVDNLVSLCSPVATTGRRELESFDLGREADLRLERERAEARRRGIALEVTTRGNLELRGDRETMLLVLRNLISNAIHWSPEGEQVRVQLDGEGREVEITVDDAGPGIQASEREKIFEPFYRGSAANGRRIGYGLGLALTRSAVEAHAGNISVESSPAGGARFRVRVPRGADDEQLA